MGTFVRIRRSYNLTTPAWSLQILIALATGFGLFLGLLVLLLTGYSAVHAGKIYPGVSVAGVDLAGLTPEKAQQVIREKILYPEHGKIAFQDQNRVWIANPAELGLYLDIQNTAQAAYQFGRSKGIIARVADQLHAWRSGVTIAPLLIYDERKAYDFLQTLAEQINKETKEASLVVNGLDVVVLPGQIGRKLETQAALKQTRDQMRTLTDGLIVLQVTQTPPKILDASLPAEAARQILSSPLTLRLPEQQDGDPGPWTILPDQLAKMLAIEQTQVNGEWRYEVGLSSQALGSYLNAIAPAIGRQPENTRFIFNDDTKLLEVIQPAVIGRQLNVENSIQKINQKMGEQSTPG